MAAIFIVAMVIPLRLPKFYNLQRIILKWTEKKNDIYSIEYEIMNSYQSIEIKNLQCKKEKERDIRTFESEIGFIKSVLIISKVL